MASIRFADVQARPTEFLDLTSLTLDEFQELVPPFEAAYQADASNFSALLHSSRLPE
jgi:hypothetical protein